MREVAKLRDTNNNSIMILILDYTVNLIKSILVCLT